MRRYASLLAVGPATIFYLIFFGAPAVAFMRLSLYHSPSPAVIQGPVSLHSYSSILGDPYYLKAILRTFELGAIVAAISVAVGYPLAHMAVRSRRFGSSIFVIVVSSMFVSSIARALGWEVLLAGSGPINRVLVWSGLAAQPLELTNNFVGVVIGMIHITIPFMVLGIMPLSESVSPQLLAAADGLGASRWYTFWHVTFPLTARGVIPVALLGFAITVGSFTTVALLGGGRVGVLAIFIQQQMGQLVNYPFGATLSVILVIGVLIPVLIGVRVSRSATAGQAGVRGG